MLGLVRLTTHEKGLIARALLMCMIEQGRFGKSDEIGQDQEIIIRLKPWQIRMLGIFYQQRH
jgi:hypothetical protein